MKKMRGALVILYLVFTLCYAQDFLITAQQPAQLEVQETSSNYIIEINHQDNTEKQSTVYALYNPGNSSTIVTLQFFVVNKENPARTAHLIRQCRFSGNETQWCKINSNRINKYQLLKAHLDCSGDCRGLLQIGLTKTSWNQQESPISKEQKSYEISNTLMNSAFIVIPILIVIVIKVIKRQKRETCNNEEKKQDKINKKEYTERNNKNIQIQKEQKQKQLENQQQNERKNKISAESSPKDQKNSMDSKISKEKQEEQAKPQSKMSSTDINTERQGKPTGQRQSKQNQLKEKKSKRNGQPIKENDPKGQEQLESRQPTKENDPNRQGQLESRQPTKENDPKTKEYLRARGKSQEKGVIGAKEQ